MAKPTLFYQNTSALHHYALLFKGDIPSRTFNVNLI